MILESRIESPALRWLSRDIGVALLLRSATLSFTQEYQMQDIVTFMFLPGIVGGIAFSIGYSSGLRKGYAYAEACKKLAEEEIIKLRDWMRSQK